MTLLSLTKKKYLIAGIIIGAVWIITLILPIHVPAKFAWIFLIVNQFTPIISWVLIMIGLISPDTIKGKLLILLNVIVVLLLAIGIITGYIQVINPLGALQISQIANQIEDFEDKYKEDLELFTQATETENYEISLNLCEKIDPQASGFGLGNIQQRCYDQIHFREAERQQDPSFCEKLIMLDAKLCRSQIN